MRDLGLCRSVELADGIVDDPVRIRDPLVLSEVFERRRDHESVQKAPFLGGMLEQAPGVGAVSPSLLAQTLDRGKESIVFLRVDEVFNGDQYRLTIRFRIDSQSRSRPMHRGREIHSGTAHSFQRQLSAIPTVAPAAATKCAAGKLNAEAIWPQSALTAVMAPKNTVTNIANPRPRTQSGNET